MLVVLPICAKDAKLAIQSLTLLASFNHKNSQPLLVIHPRGFDPIQAIDLAKKSFNVVSVHAYDDLKGNQAWPTPQNWSWQSTVRYLVSTHNPHSWLWWEPDAIPLTPSWLDVLESSYVASKKPFAGAITTQDEKVYMAGVGIYPPNILHFARASMLCRSAAFDIVLSINDGILSQTADLNPMLTHTLQPRRFYDPKEASDLVKRGVVLFHKCKDGSLIEQFNAIGNGQSTSWHQRLAIKRTTFYHSGDLGDIIYAMPTMKALGGGTLYLGPDNKSGMNTREPLTPPRVALIVPLLSQQAYVHHCCYQHQNPGVTYDLNDFRKQLSKGQLLDCKPGWNLARVPLHHFKLPVTLDIDPWLTVESPVKAAPVVFARSERYHANRFDWRKLMDEYGSSAVFVGTKTEHQKFIGEFGKVPHYPTPDLLSVARVIAGADLFVGNQSCPYAIAMGLGKTSILEHCERVPNCVFDRPNVTIGFDKATEFPLVNSVHELTITCPVENFTGYGQLTNTLILGLLGKRHVIHVNGFAIDESRVKLDNAIKSALVPANDTPSRTPGLLICSILEVPGRLVQGDILLTMWEATRLSDEMVKAINARASCVIVPTQWCATCFSASGVTVPIRVVPLGIDPKTYHYLPYPKLPPFRFGTAGRLAHAGVRKGVEETVACFLDTFPIEEDVALDVKIFEDCQLPAQTDKRITYIRRYLPTAEMIEWYRSLACFISLTKGEGWGLHIHQAMAIGRPVITPKASGQSEFVTDDNALCCRFTWQEPDWTVYKGFGQWCVPDTKHASELMRWAYENPRACSELGRTAAHSVDRYTWAKFVDGVEHVLVEFGRL